MYSAQHFGGLYFTVYLVCSMSFLLSTAQCVELIFLAKSVFPSFELQMTSLGGVLLNILCVFGFQTTYGSDAVYCKGDYSFWFPNSLRVHP